MNQAPLLTKLANPDPWIFNRDFENSTPRWWDLGPLTRCTLDSCKRFEGGQIDRHMDRRMDSWLAGWPTVRSTSWRSQPWCFCCHSTTKLLFTPVGSLSVRGSPSFRAYNLQIYVWQRWAQRIHKSTLVTKEWRRTSTYLHLEVSAVMTNPLFHQCSFWEKR